MRRTPDVFERFAQRATIWTGTSTAFLLAVLAILIWGAMGPFVSPPYNDTWQLVINTGTTIVTFLMVFLIQRSQNKDSLTIQIKLNELIAAVKGASNRLINIEDLSETEIRALHEHYAVLAERCQRERNLRTSHSIDEARKPATTASTAAQANGTPAADKPGAAPPHCGA